MSPTLNPNVDKERDICLVWKLTYSPQTGLKKGDIVTFIHPFDPMMTLVKRVAGLESDFVTGKKGSLVVPAGKMWVRSDESFRGITVILLLGVDSSELGLIPLGLVQGKAVAVIWPPSRFSLL